MDRNADDLASRVSVTCARILEAKRIDHQKINRIQRKKEGDFADEVLKVNEEKDQLKKMKEELIGKEMVQCLSVEMKAEIQDLKLEINRKEKSLESSNNVLKIKEDEVLNGQLTIARDEIDRILSEVLSEAAETLKEPLETIKIDLLDPRIILKWAEWNGVPRESAKEIFPNFRWVEEEEEVPTFVHE